MSKFKTGITAASVGILAVSIFIFVNRNGDSTTTAGDQSCALDEFGLGGFVDVKGGGFIKGADPKYSDEGPPEKIFVSPFRLQVHEVTNRQFAAFVVTCPL